MHGTASNALSPATPTATVGSPAPGSDERPRAAGSGAFVFLVAAGSPRPMIRNPCAESWLFGIVTARPSIAPRLARGVESLSRRGPDDEGYLLLDTRTGRFIQCRGDASNPAIALPTLATAGDHPCDLAFGHRRLSIVDLSPAGHQPMSARNGSLWIVFNGMIHNFLELREELAKLGHCVREPERHRGHSPRLRRMGTRLRRAIQRDVGVRDLGRPPPGALRLARPVRHQAAARRDRGTGRRLRIGAQGAAALLANPARSRSDRGAPLPLADEGAGPVHDLPAGQEGRAGALGDGSERAASPIRRTGASIRRRVPELERRPRRRPGSPSSSRTASASGSSPTSRWGRCSPEAWTRAS